MPAYGIARKDVNFEAPFGGLGSFSCKRSFFLEEYLFRAMFSVVSKERSTCETGGLTCPFFAGYRQWLSVWKKQFASGSLSRFVGIEGKPSEGGWYNDLTKDRNIIRASGERAAPGSRTEKQIICGHCMLAMPSQ